MRTVFEFKKDKKRKAESVEAAHDQDESEDRVGNSSESDVEYPVPANLYFKARLLAYVTTRIQPEHIIFLGSRKEINIARNFAIALGAHSVDIKETNSDRLLALVRGTKCSGI